ncbi:hypothetical protein DOL91_04600 [Acinetobacter baumannii]|nr:hypothetical protein DOL91_04600 [Acinetobacter baumannii]
MICRLKFLLIVFSLRNTIVRISFSQALSLLSVKSIKWIESRYIPAIFGSHTTHLTMKPLKALQDKDFSDFLGSQKRVQKNGLFLE